MTSTWPPWPRCATHGACGPPRSARCTSSSAATIIPYDVDSRVRVLQERQAAKMAVEAPDVADQPVRSKEAEVAAAHGADAAPAGKESPETGAPLSESAAKARGLLKKREPGEANGRVSAQAGEAADQPSPGVTPSGATPNADPV